MSPGLLSASLIDWPRGQVPVHVCPQQDSSDPQEYVSISGHGGFTEKVLGFFG